MKVNVSEKSAVERVVEIIVDSARLEGAYKKAFDKVRRTLALPGFRKGKVPAQLARKYIRDEGLTQDVMEAVVPGAYQEALEKENLLPLSEPHWEFVQKERGKDLIFKVTFEVKPQLEVTGYKGIQITQEKPEVHDQDVEHFLQDLRHHAARLVEMKEDRGLQEGDIALVDYMSHAAGESTGSASNYLLELKKENYIKGFVEKLYGLKAGEERTFQASFPETWNNKALAGKEVTFELKLHEIKIRELPELDDEFAKTASDKESLEELRTDIRNRLAADLDIQARRAAAGKILRKLLEEVPSEVVPRSLHTHHNQGALNRAAHDLSRQGVEAEQYLQERKITREHWAGELQAAGMVEARIELVVDAVARAEGIELNWGEVQRALATEARARRIPETKLREQLEKDGSLELLKYNVLRAQVLEFLVGQAEVTYVAPGQAEAPAAEEPEPSEAAPAAEEPGAEAEKKAPASKKEKSVAAEDVEEEAGAEAAPKKRSSGKRKSEKEKDTK